MRGCKDTKDNSLSMNPLALTLYLEALSKYTFHQPQGCSHESS